MPTLDRTTLQAALDTLISDLRTALIADPPTAAQPLRHAAVGDGRVADHPRPYLVLTPSRTRVVGLSDGDHLVELTLGLQVVTDVADRDAHGGLLSIVGAIEDYFDGLDGTGIIEGADGFDDRGWALTWPGTSAGPRPASAAGTGTLLVRVARGENRVPSP